MISQEMVLLAIAGLASGWAIETYYAVYDGLLLFLVGST